MVIAQLGSLLHKLFPSGKVYRIGGDEFALVTSEIDIDDIHLIIEKH